MTIDTEGRARRGLEGVRVLEVGQGVSAAYAGKLMADLGADVWKVEPPGGDPSRRDGPFRPGADDPDGGGLFVYLNANKRSVVVDLDDDEGRSELRRLVGWGEILVHDHPARQAERRGLSWDDLNAVNSRLVVCAITPFGMTGPYRDYAASELVLSNAGGWAYMSPGASPRPDLPPLRAFGEQCGYMSGATAALAALAAYWASFRSGRGTYVDLSQQAVVASFLDHAVPFAAYANLVANRLGSRVFYPWDVFSCADGPIFLQTLEQEQWERLVELMGNPSWASDPAFSEPFARARNWADLKPRIEEWTEKRTVDKVFRSGQERRIGFAPLLTMAELGDQEHLRSRDFFVEAEDGRGRRHRQPGAPYRLSGPWWGLRRRPPRLDEHRPGLAGLGAEDVLPTDRSASLERAERRPLDGVRVLEFSWVFAGPFCGLLLSFLGAEVIKIESQRRLDFARRMAIPGFEKGLNTSGYFNQWNQGKKSIRLNLGTPAGQDIARQLAGQCDVVIENFAPGALERLGLGYEQLRAAKPDLIMASISAFGQTGPFREYLAYGAHILHIAGLSRLTGYPGEGPGEVGMSYPDPAGGLHAAVAVCAALAARERTGEGQYIDTSMWEVLLTMLPEAWIQQEFTGSQPAPAGNRHPLIAPNNCFPCPGQDEWVAISCRDDWEWRALCAEAGFSPSDPRFIDVAARKDNEDELEEQIGRWTRQQHAWDVTRRLQAVGVPAFPSLSARDLLHDEHLAQRRFFVSPIHPEVGEKLHAGPPWWLDGAPVPLPGPAPLFGADTEEVLADVLGFSPEQIAELSRREEVLW